MIIAAFGERNTTGYMIVGVSCALIGFVVCLFHYAMTEERTIPGTETAAEDFADFVAEAVPTGSNLRGSAAYRTHLIRVLVERAMTNLRGM